MTAEYTAKDHAYVGFQGTVHVGDNYHVPPDATPEQDFRAGVQYLDARMPDEARELIDKAVAGGYENDEVRFHRLLARLSGRARVELSHDEVQTLEAICADMPPLGRGDAWTAGVRMVLRLLGAVHADGTEIVIKELDTLDDIQRTKITDHLGILIEGQLVDQLWERSIARAKANQRSGDRLNRAGLFFHPDPAGTRMAPVRPNAMTAAQWCWALLATAGLLYAYGAVGLSLLRHGALAPIIGFGVSAMGGAIMVATAAPWRLARERIRTKDAEFSTPEPPTTDAPAGGFARSVDRLFDRYFATYLPVGVDRDTWLARIGGIKRHLRNEIRELYREQDTEADKIAWLVRYLASDVRTRWQNGTLTAYRSRLRAPWRTRALCVASGAAAAIATAGWVLPTTVIDAPFHGTANLALAIVCATNAARSWVTILSERLRVKADTADRLAEYHARDAARDRWLKKLARRPSDLEMAGWLECDRKILVADTLHQYKLTPNQVIAHTFIEGPGNPRIRARVVRGPWRYTHYQLILFLLTESGVRHARIDLEFLKATAQPTARMAFRFDAVAAAHVTGLTPRQQQTFTLSLVSGEHIDVDVAEPPSDDLRHGEDVGTLFRVAVDASGVTHTLHLLEGVAAEGKTWASRRHTRTKTRLDQLSATIRDVLH